MKNIIILTILCLVSLSAFADTITHQLGNSGYAVRWAMQWGAPEKSPEHYWNSVRLQRKAQLLFAQSDYSHAVEVSRQAENEAKLSLKESGYFQ